MIIKGPVCAVLELALLVLGMLRWNRWWEQIHARVGAKISRCIFLVNQDLSVVIYTIHSVLPSNSFPYIARDKYLIFCELKNPFVNIIGRNITC